MAGFFFCGVSEEQFAINGVRHQWPRQIETLKWSMNFSRLGSLSDMDFKDVASVWFKDIESNCHRKFEYVANPRLANILYTVQRLDGKHGVLADMQVPVGNVNEGTQLIGRFDDSEIWGVGDSLPSGTIDLLATGEHETLHGLGSGHKPAHVQFKSLMASIYDPAIRRMQKIDVDEMVARYGPAKTVTPPPPPPPNSKTVYVTISQDDKVWGGQIPRIK